MQYEFEDFRNKKPNDPGPWLTWVWPRELVASYLWRIMFWTVLVPTSIIRCDTYSNRILHSINCN